MEKLSRTSSNSDNRELEKYIKFFVYKALQNVCHSRSGNVTRTQCKPSTMGSDWFNLAHPETDINNKVIAEVKNLHSKRIPGLQKPISLDIVLKTCEDNCMLLERWSFLTDKEIKEDTVRSNFSVYNRFSILIRSVVTMSRLLPAFMLSRRNDADFNIYGRLHHDVEGLQDGLFESMTIGSVPTPIGVFSAKVLYCTQVLLDREQRGSSYPLNFASDLILLSSSVSENSIKPVSLSAQFIENEIALALAEDVSPSLPGLHSGISNSNLDPNNLPTLGNINDMHFSGVSVGHCDTQQTAIAAFAEKIDIDTPDSPILALPELSPTMPFASLLEDMGQNAAQLPMQIPKTKVNNQLKEQKNNSVTSKKVPQNLKQTAQAVGFEDDFVLVELRPAFFTDEDSVGTLFRKCQSPPVLDMFATLEKEDEDSEAVDVDVQLKMYKTELMQFDEFLQSF